MSPHYVAAASSPLLVFARRLSVRLPARWADLSEPGYGVALLNDSKYGHATHGNVMRLTLLRYGASARSAPPSAPEGPSALLSC